MPPVWRRMDGQIAFYKAELKMAPTRNPRNGTPSPTRSVATPRACINQWHTAQKRRMGSPRRERMQRRVTMLAAQLDAAQATLAAAKPALYAVLTDEQKKVADELMAGHMMAMRGGLWIPRRSLRDRVASHAEQGREVGSRTPE